MFEEVHELARLLEDVLEELVRNLTRPDGAHHVILRVAIEHIGLLHGKHHHAVKDILYMYFIS